MGKNFKYIMENYYDRNSNTSMWLYSIKDFFGEEQTEAFCAEFIEANHILKENDIRNLIPTHSLSVFSFKDIEQLAFVSIYSPINEDANLINNMEEGFLKAQKFYRDKDIKLSKAISSLDYSWDAILCNWKDESKKDTYQREYVFVIYSEKDDEETFKNNIVNLLKEYNVKSVLITTPIKSDEARIEIASKIFDINTGNVITECNNTTIETIEKYLSEMSNTKVSFKIPYEIHKNILFLDKPKLEVYYSLEKQEKVKKFTPHSFNIGIRKQSLVARFDKQKMNNKKQ